MKSVCIVERECLCGAPPHSRPQRTPATMWPPTMRHARGASRLASGRDLPRCTWGTAACTATASRPHARLEQRWSVRCGRGPGRTFWRGRSVDARRIVSSRVKPAPAKLGRGLRRQQAAGTSAGRPRGRQVNCTQQRAGWHLTSIISSVTDDLPLLRAHFSWHNLAQVAWEGSRLPCCGCIGGWCSRRAFCLRRLPWRLVARA